MLDRFIGKNVELMVAFGAFAGWIGAHSSAGSLTPVAYYGVLKEVDDDYCILSLTHRRPNTFTQCYSIVANAPSWGENCSGDICIRKEYIISCLELR